MAWEKTCITDNVQILNGKTSDCLFGPDQLSVVGD